MAPSPKWSCFLVKQHCPKEFQWGSDWDLVICVEGGFKNNSAAHTSMWENLSKPCPRWCGMSTIYSVAGHTKKHFCEIILHFSQHFLRRLTNVFWTAKAGRDISVYFVGPCKEVCRIRLMTNHMSLATVAKCNESTELTTIFLLWWQNYIKMTSIFKFLADSVDLAKNWCKFQGGTKTN